MLGSVTAQSKQKHYPDFTDFPETGRTGLLYVDDANADLYLWNEDDEAYELQSGSGGGAWGSITGTLSDQTDLQSEIDTKEQVLNWDINPSRQFVYFTDFNEADRANLNVTADAGGGSGTSATNDSTTGADTTENAHGAVALVTGSGTTARLGIYGAAQHIIGNMRMRYGWRSLLSNASTGTDTYTAHFGMSDNVGPGDGTIAVWIRYTDSVNGGRWQGVVIDSSTEVVIDLGVAPSFGSYQVLEFDINEAGTSVEFFIDGVSCGTINSGLPGAGDNMRWVWKITKSAGTNSVQLTTDWFYYKLTRSSPR